MRANSKTSSVLPSLAITAMFCWEFAYVFRLSVSMRKLASEHPFCVLIYMKSYIFRIYFILFIFLSNTYLILNFICFTLSLTDTHGIANYKCIRTYTHTHTPKKSRQSREKKGRGGKKRKGVQGRKKEKEKKDRNKKRENKKRRKLGGGGGEKNKEGGGWFQGGRGAWERGG